MTEVSRVPIVKNGSDVEPESRWIRTPALGDAIAQMVLLIDRPKAGYNAGVLEYAAALPSDALQRFIGPFALAWSRIAAGDLAGADTALQGLDKFNGFKPLKVFQLALLYDF